VAARVPRAKLSARLHTRVLGSDSCSWEELPRGLGSPILGGTQTQRDRCPDRAGHEDLRRSRPTWAMLQFSKTTVPVPEL